jgi:hypothetical protein
MATTNYTINGQNFFIKTELGERFESGGIALVQWEVGYDPKYRPMQEWTSNPTIVSWTGWYQRDYPGVGTGVFGSNGTTFDTAGPIYLYVDFGNSSNYNHSTMMNQVWMGQVTDMLTLPGGSVELQLSASSIRSVVGTNVGGVLFSQDITTWQPTAIPEPSYSAFAVVLFAVALIAKKVKQCTK